MIDFTLTALQQRTRHFVAEQVMPYENDPRQTPHGPGEALREELVARVRGAATLWRAHGGQ